MSGWGSLPLLVSQSHVRCVSRELLRRIARGDRCEDQEFPDDASHSSRVLRVTQRGVAIVSVRGILGKFNPWFGEASSAELVSVFRGLSARRDISAVLLVIDSPGGSVEGQAELIDAAVELASIHPVYAHVDDVCASAAYWLACCARTISANRLSVVGSIGCYSVVYDLSRAYSDDGIVTRLISSGDLKGAGAPGTEVPPEAIEQWRALVDGVMKDFSSFVRAARTKVDSSAWLEIERGGVFSASQALSLGLIDRISSVRDAIENLAVSPPIGLRRRRLELLKTAGTRP